MMYWAGPSPLNPGLPPQVCARMCESTGTGAQRTVAVLLPTLLEKGIVSNVAEVRSLRYCSAQHTHRSPWSCRVQPARRQW